MNLPRFYPYAKRKVGFEWSNPSRINRINEVLNATTRFSMADAMALQTDPTDVTLKLMTGPLQAMTSSDTAVVQARDIILAWDGRTTTDSAGAALYETWVHKHLGAAAVRLSAPEASRALLGQGEIAAVMAWLNDKDSADLRNQVLETSLAAAMTELSGRLGTEVSAWRWGDLHQARFEHALTPMADPLDRASLAAGPLPMAGTSLSPLAATWRPDSFRVTAGASFRMVLDVGAWDNSRTINTPGQSGEPDSAHFRDLFPVWARGDYVPLTYSRQAVEAVTEQVLILTPAKP
jgi:penicillin amidase